MHTDGLVQSLFANVDELELKADERFVIDSNKRCFKCAELDGKLKPIRFLGRKDNLLVHSICGDCLKTNMKVIDKMFDDSRKNMIKENFVKIDCKICKQSHKMTEENWREHSKKKSQGCCALF